MKAQLAAILLAALAAGCEPGEPTSGGGSTTPARDRSAAASAPAPDARPVTIGELGPNFPACYAMARFRDRIVAEREAIAVRAAPFDEAPETGRLAASAQFFICTRTHDQRWFAVVWDEAEGASRRCGVSQPLSVRRDYSGPCESGWIPSVLVRLESGILHREPEAANSTN